jgi:hypothetical protein
VLTRLWSGERFAFEGEHFHVRDTEFHPGPLQRPRIPIWIAGMWPNRAPFRRAVRFDGVVPLAVDEVGLPTHLEPTELARVVAYVRAHRTEDAPFEVVHGGPPDPRAIGVSEAWGATWYLAEAGVEGPGWEEPTRELIRSGPPRAQEG